MALDSEIGLPPKVRDMTMDTIPKLDLTASEAYTQSELQAVATKLDAIITALQRKGLMK
jgi:hypothetical protein